MLRKKSLTTISLSSVALILIVILITRFYSSSTNVVNLNLSKQPSTIYPYIAITISYRTTTDLVTAVLNVLDHIPTDWKVQIFTVDEHWPFYQQSSLAPYIENNRVFMTPIDFPGGTAFDPNFLDSYLTSTFLWRQVRGEKVLLFQSDSAICSNSLYRITDFLHYDFIGAPWKEGGCCNGGLSIRSRSKTLLLLESDFGRYPVGQVNEDGWFAGNLHHVNGLVAPVSVAKAFSVETIYHHRPFSVRRPRLTDLGEEQMALICNECPEARRFTHSCLGMWYK